MKTIKIGRSRDNDCVLDSPSVSRVHAVLIVDDNGLGGTLKDLNSTHGTFLNDSHNRITREVRVTYSDKMRFGDTVLSISDIVRLSEQKSNSTVISTPQHANRRTIGKNADNNIVMNNDDVSRKHAVLYKDASGNVVIEDLGSTNGTFVNGMRVTKQVLKSGDKVTITQNYPLNWETVFGGVPPTPSSKKSSFRALYVIIPLLIVLFIGSGVGAFFLFSNKKYTSKEIYQKYNSSVCWVLVQYGYKVLVDKQDITPFVCEQVGIKQSEYIHIQGENFAPGIVASEGTAFFISKDGKLATNLHIASPWLFSNDIVILERVANAIVAQLATAYPQMSRSKVEILPQMVNIFVVPNGLPIANSNAVECTVLKAQDDVEKDVAVLQTVTRSLPSQVKEIVDVEKIEISKDDYKIGNVVYTIGYPYGSSIGLSSNKDLSNQVHRGEISQDRGDYSFGHDAATASGASGSPVFDEYGRLIGVHNAGMTGVTGAQGFNRAIKVKYLLELLD